MKEAFGPADFRRFVLAVLSAFFGIYGGLLAATNWVVDPYMETGASAFGLAPRKFSHSLASTRTLFDKLRGDRRYALVFGTSRSALVSPAVTGEPTLNFHALYGSPYAVNDLLRQLDSHQTSNISRIYYLLDVHCFKGRKYFIPLDERAPWDALLFSLRNFDLDKFEEAGRALRLNRTKSYDYYLDEDGFEVRSKESTWDPRTELLDTDDPAFTPDAMEQLAQVDRFARERGIPIVYYTPPLPKAYLQAIGGPALSSIREAFAERIPSFYDLSYLRWLSKDPSAFSDSSHVKIQPMEKIYKDILIPGNTDFLTSRENLARRIADLRLHAL